MPSNFVMYRVFCSTPGDLEAEREIFTNLAGEVNEAVGLNDGVLLVPLSCTRNSSLGPFLKAFEQNVQQCTYFVQVIDDGWGPKSAFKGLFDLAAQCHADPRLPMRDVVIFVKAGGPDRKPRLSSWLRSVERRGVFRVFRYDTPAAYAESLKSVLAQWLEERRSELRQKA